MMTATLLRAESNWYTLKSVQPMTRYIWKINMARLFVSCSLSLLLVSIACAEKNAEITPNLFRAESLLAEDSFEKTTLSDKYAAAKGEWKVVDGALVGKELKADKHAAVLTYKQSNRDSRIRFSFLLDGTNGFHLSFNHAKGHLFRVMVSEDKMLLRTDKNKKDPKSKPILLDQVKGKVAPGEWHTLLVEVMGEKVSVQLDNGMELVGSHPSLAIDKPNYRFVMRGEALKIDDLKIWAEK